MTQRSNKKNGEENKGWFSWMSRIVSSKKQEEVDCQAKANETKSSSMTKPKDKASTTVKKKSNDVELLLRGDPDLKQKQFNANTANQKKHFDNQPHLSKHLNMKSQKTWNARDAKAAPRYQ